jgi:hypothetical protein
MSVVKIVKKVLKHVLGGGWDERQQRERETRGVKIFSICVSLQRSQCNYAAAA